MERGQLPIDTQGHDHGIQHRTNRQSSNCLTINTVRSRAGRVFALPSSAACTARMNGNPLRTEPPQLRRLPVRTVPAARQDVSLLPQVCFFFCFSLPSAERGHVIGSPARGTLRPVETIKSRSRIQTTHLPICASFGPLPCMLACIWCVSGCPTVEPVARVAPSTIRPSLPP